jgi:hypothetical protein
VSALRPIRQATALLLAATCLPAASLSVTMLPAGSVEAPDLRLEPKVPPLSAYEFTGRIRIHNKDVSFEAPADYRESFSFWAEKMTGTLKEEKIEYITVTRDRAEDGSVPFRRQVPRYDLEITKPGKSPTVLPKQIRRAVTSKVWEGTFDRYGNAVSMQEIAGEEEETVKDLSFPFLDYLFPTVDGPQDLGIGEKFTSRTRGNLPTRLMVSGLEDVGLILVRTYTLREVGPETATFDVTIGFEADPDRPSARDKTTCTISGSGSGAATFDRRLGVFTASNLSSSLIFDIKAPLRKLPTQAEGFDPGLGTSRIELMVQMDGDRTVTELLGESAAPAPAAD